MKTPKIDLLIDYYYLNVKFPYSEATSDGSPHLPGLPEARGGFPAQEGPHPGLWGAFHWPGWRV